MQIQYINWWETYSSWIMPARVRKELTAQKRGQMHYADNAGFNSH